MKQRYKRDKCMALFKHNIACGQWQLELSYLHFTEAVESKLWFTTSMTFTLPLYHKYHKELYIGKYVPLITCWDVVASYNGCAYLLFITAIQTKDIYTVQGLATTISY